jgi:hypothetical protein
MTKKEEVEFPQMPNDHITLGLMKGLTDLTQKIQHHNNTGNEELRLICCYLYVIADAPYTFPYCYFRFHQDLKNESASLGDHYNHYIHSQGQDYMLEVLNREIGPFADYFNEFQYIMYGLNSLTKNDSRYEPFSNLLWGFYCSLYDTKKRMRFLRNALKSLEDGAKEQRGAQNN